MTIKQGSVGTFEVCEDFLGGIGEVTWGAGVGVLGDLHYTSVNEGTFAITIDEPGGVIAVTTDTADNDNWFGFAGMFRPSDGPVWVETRIKVGNVATTQTAVNVGFYDILAKDTPVMMFEYATATMTITGSGADGAVLMFDTDGTAITWRAASVKAAVATGTANGFNTGKAPVDDRWDVVRVELEPTGLARYILNGEVVQETANAVTAATNYYAIVGIENRAAGGEVLEIDYIKAGGSRDWDDA